MITPLLSAILGRTSIEFELSESLGCSADSSVEAAGVDLRLWSDCEDHERGRANAAADRPPTVATSTRSKLAQALARLALNRAGMWAPKPRARRLEFPNSVEHRGLLLRRPRGVALGVSGRMPQRAIGRTRVLCGGARLFRGPALALRFQLSSVSRHDHQASVPARRSPSGTTGPRGFAGGDRLILDRVQQLKPQLAPERRDPIGGAQTRRCPSSSPQM